MSIFPGSTLRLLDDQSQEIQVTRKDSAAAGRFRVRRRGSTDYVTFEYFSRRTGTLENRYIGTIRRTNP